mgnify:CR=1 FL=1
MKMSLRGVKRRSNPLDLQYILEIAASVASGDHPRNDKLNI